jgi:hypothetical protein
MYSEPPNTGPSGIRMVIFQTLFKSGFQMVKGSHFVKTIQKPEWSAICLPFENRTEVF